MEKFVIADSTLRVCSGAEYALDFKERVAIAKILTQLGVDVIETPEIVNGKSDVLFLHTLATLATRQVISCPVALDAAAVAVAGEAVAVAGHPRLMINVPVSTVQIEYHCHCKPPVILERIADVVAKAVQTGCEVEVSLNDATRAEKSFLHSAIEQAIAAGAKVITVCDSAGIMLPSEFAAFIQGLRSELPALEKVMLSVECSDALHTAMASAISCVKNGVKQIKTAAGIPGLLKVTNIADLLRAKGRALELECGLNMTACGKLARQAMSIISGGTAAGSSASPVLVTPATNQADWRLTNQDDMPALAAAVRKMGYELSADDLSKVYEEFKRISGRREVSPRDLDEIISAVALQVPSVYKLKSFVVNSGNIITSMAHVTLLKGQEELTGYSDGNGPIDAAFQAIEKILGRHFELDDFQVSSVTEDVKAMGKCVVRIRSNGKIYCGQGISTDVIGAGIRACVSAINKICHEENE